MVFYIHDQGERMVTPVSTNFPQRGVREIAAASGQVISNDETHQNEAFETTLEQIDPAVRRSAGGTRRSALKIYEEQSQPETEPQELMAKDIMQPSPRKIMVDTPWENVAEALQEEASGLLMVMKESDRLFGILSNRSMGDWLKRNAGQDIFTQPPNAQRLCNQKFYSCMPNATVRDLSSLFIRENLNAVPVVDQNNKLRGIITATGLMQALLNMTHKDSWV
ncbi:CBS domain-containing protein [Pokkaliibacter sp. CJK22405]|uniref:CBS domain-containing protein n=1 Tax=Pokkaliibacter sp. CJK22405 TaxID=3384615 RepID=UPI003985006D